MRIAGVPETGHHSFVRISYRDLHGSMSWYTIDSTERIAHSFGAMAILAWWPDGTPEDQMEKAPRTNWKWQPSNGDAGASFIDHFCGRCIHDRAHQLDDTKPGCPIVANGFAFRISDPEYPEEWTDRDGDPRCTKFTPYIEGDLTFDEDGNAMLPTPRCTDTPDLFT
jgi:hypothetical protein